MFLSSFAIFGWKVTLIAASILFPLGFVITLALNFVGRVAKKSGEEVTVWWRW